MMVEVPKNPSEKSQLPTKLLCIHQVSTKLRNCLNNFMTYKLPRQMFTSNRFLKTIVTDRVYAEDADITVDIAMIHHDIPWYNYHLVMTNIAIENHNFLIGKPSINGPFSMAMSNNQRVIQELLGTPKEKPIPHL